MDLNKWYHVAYVLDGTNVYLYINGVLDKSCTLAYTMGSSSANRFIGSASGNGYFSGIIDELRISNIVRSASEFRQQYETGMGIRPNDATNPYSSTVSFKAHNYGDYTISCKATDTDRVTPLSGAGVVGMSVNDQAQTVKYCSILNLKDDGQIDFRDRTVCVENEGIPAMVKNKAYLYNIDPEKYYWKCSNTDSGDPIESTEDTQTCTYSVNEQSYRPYLSVKDRNTEQPIDCNRTVSTRVTCIPRCTVGVRPWGSGGDPAASTSIAKNEEVEAIVTEQCLDGGETSWNVVNGTVVSSTTKKLRVNIGNVLQSKIQATVTKEGVITTCDEATVEVTEKVKWSR